MGLARLAADQFSHVQTFKKGPDYIDPQWLKQASGKPCYNLDSFQQDENDLSALFIKHAGDCTFVEGTMGLHDGICVDGTDSNAAIAKLLGLPVLLIIDCRGMHRTIAPLVNGIVQFDADVKFTGILLNRVRSDRHAGKIERAVREYCDTRVLGLIPELPELCIDERELGLVPASDHSAATQFIDTVAGTLQSACDTDAIFESNIPSQLVNQTPVQIAAYPTCDNVKPAVSTPLFSSAFATGYSNTDSHSPALRIGIARDEAFHFYYEDDLDNLRSTGAQLIEFSPLRDALPVNLDGLILGGGFPERHLAALSENAECRETLARAIENGLPVRAECGGLMYLCESIAMDNVLWPMVGAIPGTATMHEMPKGRGYMQLVSNDSNKLHKKGIYKDLLKGTMPAHEFHHSTIEFHTQPDFAFSVKRGFGMDGRHDGVRVHNVLASYAHFRHTARTPWIDWFLHAVRCECSIGQTEHATNHV